MKHSITILLIVLSLQTPAQDIIYTIDGSEISALVIEITSDFVKYKHFYQPDGPIRNVAIVDVFLIIYSDGSKEVFKQKKKSNDSIILNSDSMVQNETKAKDENLNQENTTQPELLYIDEITEKKSAVYTDLDHNSSSEVKNKMNDKYFTNRKNEYFSTALGYGTSYGGFGLRGDFRVGKKVGFGAHFGAGYFPFNGGGFLTGGGVKFYCYKGLYIDIQYGLVGIEKIKVDVINGNSINHKEKKYVLHGPSFLFGGDWFFGKHVGLNAALGFTKVINSVLMELAITMDIGIIIKY